MSAKSSAQKAQKLFTDAATKLQRGDAAGARRGLERVSRMAPDSAAVWYNLALAGQHLGLHSKAIREYEKSLRISPGQVDALVNIGLSHKLMGNANDAMTSTRKALLLAPSHPRALNLLGSLHGESGDSEAACDCFRKALNSNPDNIDARHNLANTLYECGDSDKALEVLNPLLAQPGITLEHQELYGQILLDLRRFDLVQPLIKDLKSRYQDEEKVLILEMSFCESIKDHFSVIEIAQKVLARSPKLAKVWNALGSSYFQLDSIEKAKDSYRKAIDCDPEHPEYRNNIGLAYASLGEKQQAEENYRAAISLNSDYVEAYRNLVHMKKFKSLDDSDIVALEALWNRDDQDDRMRCRLAFALGKVYDDCGLYDKAFKTYDVGNKLKSKEIAKDGFDFDKYFDHIDRIAEILDRPPTIKSNAPKERAKPIFILGMSRSGTTLVEQIISRHPDVTGCGELPCIDRAIARLEKNYGAMQIYPDDFHGFGKEALDSEATEYLDWVVRLHDLSTGFFTDKMPFNFAHIWLIRALFPEAAIVHCHRHPLDVIVSNYFQLYGSEINYVYELKILARFYIRYYRLMRHWNLVFPGNIYTVKYEALVADNETQTRMLIDGAGLEWDDACLDQKRSDTAVRTASIWQVRQGIYTSSKERWRRYERHLSPAIEILQSEGILDEDLIYLE